MFLADFHIHSSFSDGKLTVPALIDLYGRRGFGAIAITDHVAEEQSLVGKASAYLNQTLTRSNFTCYLDTLRAEAARAWDQYRMVVLPGFELSKNSLLNHRSAHILGISLLDSIHYLSADGDAIDLIRGVKSMNGLAIAAHPVWTRKVEKQTYHLWERRHELAPLFDAWEVASGPVLFEEVANTRLPKIANSDLHRPSQLRAWKTVLECERHPEAILDAIRNQELSFRFYETSERLGIGKRADELRAMA